MNKSKIVLYNIITLLALTALGAFIVYKYNQTRELYLYLYQNGNGVEYLESAKRVLTKIFAWVGVLISGFVLISSNIDHLCDFISSKTNSILTIVAVAAGFIALIFGDVVASFVTTFVLLDTVCLGIPLLVFIIFIIVCIQSNKMKKS